MKNRQQVFIYTLSILLSTFFFGCATTIRKGITENDKTVYYRGYTYNKWGKKKKTKDSFKRKSGQKTYPRYADEIIWDTINGTTFIQTDTTRVYLQGDAREFDYVFKNGIITGEMIFCCLSENCEPYKEMFFSIDKVTGDTAEIDLWGWTGPTINIDHFEEFSGANIKSTQRKFIIWVWPWKYRWNCHNDLIYVVFTNENANRKTDIKTFLTNSNLTYIYHGGTM